MSLYAVLINTPGPQRSGGTFCVSGTVTVHRYKVLGTCDISICDSAYLVLARDRARLGLRIGNTVRLDQRWAD